MEERPFAERLGPRPVGDRPAHELGRPLDDPAGRERIPRVGRQLRFDADDPGARAEGVDGRRDTGCEPAAADRDEDRGDVRQVLDDLEAARALAGDDPIVVVRRDDREAALGRDPLGDDPALRACRPNDDDLGSVRGDTTRLELRRIGRHDDDRRRAEEPRRAGDALGVVAGRVGDHAAGPLVG